MKGIYICLVIIYLLKLKIAECLPKFWEKRCPRISYKAADCNILQAPWSFVCIHQNLEEHFNWCVIRKKKLDLVFKEIHFSFLLFNVCFEKENYEVCCQVILGGKKCRHPVSTWLTLHTLRHIHHVKFHVSNKVPRFRRKK